MADNEIQILITAVNQTTETLKGIQKDMQGLADDSKKSNEKLATSFKSVQMTMLNLGQVAQGVHNIFEIYQNRTRLLENAQDRLENSTLRLQQAQEGLRDVTRGFADDNLNLKKATLNNARAQEELKKYTDRLAQGFTFGAEKTKDYEDAQLAAEEAALDLVKAQQAVSDQSYETKKAQDAVTIAQNAQDKATRGLEKATSDANWMYVDMATNLVSVAGNMSLLATNAGWLKGALGIGGLATGAAEAETAIGVVGTGLGLAGALGLLGGVLIALPMVAAMAQADALGKAYEDAGGKINTAHGYVKAFSDDLQAMADTTGGTTGFEGTRMFTMSDEAKASMPGVSPDIINAKPGEWVSSPEPSTSSNQVATGGGFANFDKGPLGYIQKANAEAKTAKEKSFPEMKQSFDTNLSTMGTSTGNQVQTINIKLGEIKKDIYTYHHIITVYG